jgi:hypothetical protein
MGRCIAMAAESCFLLRKRRKQTLVKLTRIVYRNKSCRNSMKGSASIVVADTNQQHNHTGHHKKSRVKCINSAVKTREIVIQPHCSGEYPVVSIAHSQKDKRPSRQAFKAAAPLGLQSEKDDISKNLNVVPFEVDYRSVVFGLHSAADRFFLACIRRICLVVAEERGVRIPAGAFLNRYFQEAVARGPTRVVGVTPDWKSQPCYVMVMRHSSGTLLLLPPMTIDCQKTLRLRPSHLVNCDHLV